MKTCTKCKITKESFPKRSASKDGLSSWCTSCFSEHSKNKYASDAEERARKKKNVDRLIEKTREYIFQYLKKNPCVVCGESDIVVLEFDHRNPDEKKYNVSEMMKFSVESLKNEIKKCDVLCANCHRRKTAAQFGTWRNGM